jgi:site-specific recombinase XerC
MGPQLPGFGVRVRPSGATSYIVVYRAGSGRGPPVRRFTIASVGKTAPEKARKRAPAILGAVAQGRDPAGEKTTEAETTGVPWNVDVERPTAKHLAKKKNRFAKLSPFATAALRLLLFTGCRLREILNLKWENVDLERGLLFLPESKTGRKTIILNALGLAVLTGLDWLGSYVAPGDDAEKPRTDLKRPWRAVSKRAGLEGVRLHDLRHTYASFGAGGGLGLPIIGKLLGHTQASTTARYAHLDNDPLRRAAESICSRIAAALGGKKGSSVAPLKSRRR